jgi:Leucine-rich repeat (LRR) protein
LLFSRCNRNKIVNEYITNNSRFVSDFQQLVKIDLSNNLLSKFPKFTTSIQQINLSRNLIKEVSIEIKELEQLHELDLSYSYIHILPEIPNNLIYLNLLENSIENVFQEILRIFLITKSDKVLKQTSIISIEES